MIGPRKVRSLLRSIGTGSCVLVEKRATYREHCPSTSSQKLRGSLSKVLVGNKEYRTGLPLVSSTRNTEGQSKHGSAGGFPSPWCSQCGYRQGQFQGRLSGSCPVMCSASRPHHPALQGVAVRHGLGGCEHQFGRTTLGWL